MKYVLSSYLDKHTFITLCKAGFKFRILGLLGVQPRRWWGELSRLQAHSPCLCSPPRLSPAPRGASTPQGPSQAHLWHCHPQEDGPGEDACSGPGSKITASGQGIQCSGYLELDLEWMVWDLGGNMKSSFHGEGRSPLTVQDPGQGPLL